MSFDGIFLHKIIEELEIVKTGRITKIMESGDTDFIFTIRTNHQNYNLLISLSCDYARIHFTTKSYDFPATPKSLTMFLRKHIEGYFIEDLYQYGNDRIIILKLSGYNEMKDLNHKYLICEIMGRYSNLILTDENYIILEVLKKTGITEFGRTMLSNALYHFPEQIKLNPYTLSLEEMLALNLSSPKELCQAFEGIGSSLASAAFLKENAILHFYNLIHQKANPVLFLNTTGKKDFYCFPLGNNDYKKYSTLSTLLDEFYFETDNQAKIKLKTNDLENFIQKQIIKNEKKIKKLSQEALTASSAEEYKLKGELLLSYPHLKDKEERISIWNYYTQEEILIDLNPKYDVITNSQKYYKKYQKAKTAKHYIQEQIKLATSEIEYFKVLLEQLKCASINDALEIRQELVDHHYLLDTQKKNTKKNKPNYLTYLIDGVIIYVGKNNLQNEYLTHKLAKATDYWFHIQNASGSHVIVCSNELTENLCRVAAMLAANYSSFKESSSIPVDYTQVKNIKKIPGKKSCFVSYTKQKTIYIDIDKTIIENLKVKK
ncbi:MAG: NFACT family protein [Anaeroplasmataceae bacterium]|nr:NFACT family protein [Anaeroplasmataceae bacterium]